MKKVQTGGDAGQGPRLMRYKGLVKLGILNAFPAGMAFTEGKFSSMRNIRN